MAAARKPPSKSDRRNGPLLRLVASLLLFLLFWGTKCCFPSQTAALRQQVSHLLSLSVDFPKAFSQLGRKLEEEGDIVGAVGDWCVTVFAPEQMEWPEKESPSF